MSILTVTLNPALDHIVDPAGERIISGGKGVNVSRALKALGVPSSTLIVVAGSNGRRLCRDLRQEGLAVRTFQVLGETRINVTQTHADGQITRIVRRGPRWTSQDVARFLKAFSRIVDGYQVVVFSGSLSPAVPATMYRDLARIASAKGAEVWLDTSKAALRHGIMGPVYGVKPNREEAQALLGLRLSSRRSVKKALQSFLDCGMTSVLLTLGSAGSVIADPERCVWAKGSVLSGHSVGCGDAALAGVLAARSRKMNIEEQVRWATACGCANVSAQKPGGIKIKNVKKIYSQITLERV